MLQIRLRAAVASNHYAGVWSAPIPTEGFAIPNDRLWSKWRRHRDGTSGSSPAPRSLKHLLKQVEKGTQVRHSGLKQVLAELELHRDATPDPEARSALAWLCNSVSRFVRNPTPAHAREVVIAVDTVKRVPAASD
jgi:hypothetical protein